MKNQKINFVKYRKSEESYLTHLKNVVSRTGLEGKFDTRKGLEKLLRDANTLKETDPTDVIVAKELRHTIRHLNYALTGYNTGKPKNPKIVEIPEVPQEEPSIPA